MNRHQQCYSVKLYDAERDAIKALQERLSRTEEPMSMASTIRHAIHYLAKAHRIGLPPRKTRKNGDRPIS